MKYVMLQTLRLNKDFKSAYYWGKSAVGGGLITYVRRVKRLPGGGLAASRYGITTGKKVGNAVQRNRCRRLIREAFRLLVRESGIQREREDADIRRGAEDGGIRRGVDIVFVARDGCARLKMPQVQKQMRRQLIELQVLREPKGVGETGEAGSTGSGNPETKRLASKSTLKNTPGSTDESSKE